MTTASAQCRFANQLLGQLLHVELGLKVANPISEALVKGTYGELLVQLRLLQHGVQAAPPLKDSGNDLIALKGEVVRTIQVKTTTNELPPWPEERKLYHLLAVVQLHGEGTEVLLDQSEVFLIPKQALAKLPRRWEALGQFRLCAEHVAALFK